MKEATGELSMTVVTIIAVVAIAGVVGWLAPKVSQYITDQWGAIEGAANTCPAGQHLNGQNQCVPN